MFHVCTEWRLMRAMEVANCSLNLMMYRPPFAFTVEGCSDLWTGMHVVPLRSSSAKKAFPTLIPDLIVSRKWLCSLESLDIARCHERYEVEKINVTVEVLPQLLDPVDACPTVLVSTLFNCIKQGVLDQVETVLLLIFPSLKLSKGVIPLMSSSKDEFPYMAVLKSFLLQFIARPI